MTPKIYGVMGSPPVSAVLSCARALGIEVELEKVNVFKVEHIANEDFCKINPQHTIPLLDDDGFILADSHAINGYLVGKYGKENDPLYPKDDIKRRALIEHRLFLDATIIAGRGFLVSIPFVLKQLPTQKAIDALRDGFSILDKQIQLQNTKYIAGNALSIADFSITASVIHWGMFLKNWESDFANVNDYIDRMKLEEWFEVCQGSKVECSKVFAEAIMTMNTQYE